MEEDEIRSIFDLWSPVENDATDWKKDYNLSDWEDYESCPDSVRYSNPSPGLWYNAKYNIDNFEFPTSFVSFDFENLFPQRVTACSVGMVKYKNGAIVDKYYTLIRPPFEYEGKKGQPLTWIHGFKEDDFEGQPTFAEALPKMEEFIEGLPPVAHNACVERACIHDCCAYYKIKTSIPYEDIIDTYLLSKYIDEKMGITIKGGGFHSLNVVCQRYGVEVLRHHHACDDAEMCGNLLLTFPKYLTGERTLGENAWRLVSEYSAKPKQVFKLPYQTLEARGHTSFRGDILQKDLTCADPANPFYDRKVVITGVFDIDRQELAKTLKGMGADIDTGVGNKTNYLLIGEEPGPSKMRKVDELIKSGKDVRKIYQEDLYLILSGKCYEKYRTEQPVSNSKAVISHERKTTWPNLVKKFKQYVDGENIEFSEKELGSEDYRLLELYYKQQQKIATTKETILSNLRNLDDADECNFKREILECFSEGETISKETACGRMQEVFTKYGLQFKAKSCVLTELGVDFKEYKDNRTKTLHLTINKKPAS